MSKETFEKLEEALRDHIQNEHGTYLTGFVICASSAFPLDSANPDLTQYSFPLSPMPMHSALGLLEVAGLWFRTDQSEAA